MAYGQNTPSCDPLNNHKFCLLFDVNTDNITACSVRIITIWNIKADR